MLELFKSISQSLHAGYLVCFAKYGKLLFSPISGNSKGCKLLCSKAYLKLMSVLPLMYMTYQASSFGCKMTGLPPLKDSKITFMATRIQLLSYVLLPSPPLFYSLELPCLHSGDPNINPEIMFREAATMQQMLN